MTADQPREDAIAAHIDNLIRNYTEDRSLTRDDVLRDLEQLRHVAALAPADPTADLRADIEHRARMQDALDALMQATLWVHRTVDMPREPKSWDSKARSGIVGLRAALAAAPKVESVRAASERLGIPIGHVRDYPHRFAPFEDDGLVQRAHVACCWCGEHHEEGR